MIQAAELLKDIRDLHFLLVGINKKELISKEVINQHILEKFTCVGIIRPPEKVNSYINSMDICVLPGTNWYCSPMKLFEYGAVSKPIIAVDMSNVKEILDSDDYALFFRDGDTIELVEKIKYLYYNKDIRQRMGREFKEKVLNIHTWDNNTKKILSIYKDIAASI